MKHVLTGRLIPSRPALHNKDPNMRPKLTKATAYFDGTDAQNPGWAYRLFFETNPEESHEESGPLDTIDKDEGDDARAELKAMIADHSGPADAVVVLNHDDGSYRWQR